jgi:hypothetical protein
MTNARVIALIGTVVASAAMGTYELFSANSKRRRAARRREDAEKRLSDGQERQARAWMELEQDSQSLILAQTAALALLGRVVDWLEAGRVESHDWGELTSGPAPDLLEWKKESIKANELIRDALGTVSIGAAAPTVATALATRFGVAGTGAAISTLSGAAARNATLAWLGGGSLASGGGGMALGSMVLGGLNIGLTVLAVGMTAKKVAIKYDSSVEEFVAKVDAALLEDESRRKLWTVARQRFDQVRRAVNGIGRATLRAMEVGDASSPEDYMAVVSLGMSLSKLARLSPLDEQNELIEEWDGLLASVCDVEFAPSDDPLYLLTSGE